MSIDSYFREDTIAAPATRLGGAIAVLRISGSDSVFLLKKLLSQEDQARELIPRQAHLVRLRDEKGREIEEAIVTFFKGPNSFTGEDCIEVATHGGEVGVSLVLKTLYAFGVKAAKPGEFSFRAVKNGKMDVLRAESIRDLIEASHESEYRMAYLQYSGHTAKLFTGFQERIQRLGIFSELGIDFSDQDVDEVRLQKLKEDVLVLIDEMDAILAQFDRATKIKEGVRLALFGAPNVGKSSLFNALTGEETSIVTEIAGTTRDVVKSYFIYQGLNGSLKFTLSDTAGVRETEDQVEKLGVARSRGELLKSDLQLLVLDDREESFETLKTEWVRYVGEKGIGTPLVVLNKMDRLNPGEVSALTDRVERELGLPMRSVSSITREGIPELVNALVSVGEEVLYANTVELPVVTRAEHREALQASRQYLEEARSACSEDLFASDVRHALSALAPVFGDFGSEEILGAIFSKFCIGK